MRAIAISLIVYLFGVLLFSVTEGVPQSTNSSSLKSYNGTRSSGVCTLEVPTVDLLSEEERHGVIPTGNGSRPGFSRIKVCCSGYRPIPHTFHHCEPICENGCINGNCTAPNRCICLPGFVYDLAKNCVPTCPKECLNGYCTNNGTCSCHDGYRLEPNGKFCVPHCPGGCGVGGNCTAPGHCECDKGFQRNPRTGTCEYYCEGGCNGGSCIGPNKCSCKAGYVQKNDLTCEAQCPRGCKNGLCTAPNVCSCKEGWTLGRNGIECIPHCESPCLNGVCVAPNACECNKGYIKDPRSLQGNRCVAHCEEECVNGQCSGPNFCICNPGYIKESRHSNKCIKRNRRSALHMELIPPQF